MGIRTRHRAIVLMLGLALAGCDVGSIAGENAVKRTTVEISNASEETTLELIPSRLSFGSDPWAEHQVDFSIATDDWVQHVSVFDRYVVDDGELVPTNDAVATDFVLSDESQFGGSFHVRIDDLPLGQQVVGFKLPVSLEVKPRWEGQLIPHDTILRVEFVYDVFMADDPLVTFCAEADQMLGEGATRFDAAAFADAGEGVLDPGRISELQSAAVEYEEEVATNGHWDPSRFSDLVEETCDVEYEERWQAFS